MNWFTRIVCGLGMKQGSRLARLARLAIRLLFLLSVLLSLLLPFLLVPVDLLAQSSNAVSISFGPVISPFTTISANAPYRVCLASAIGLPCSTAGVLLYSDINLTHPLSNPAFANSQGIVNAFTTPGTYQIQLTPTPSQTYTYYAFLSAGSGGLPTVCEVNGTPISPASPCNFVDTASVTWQFTGGQIQATAVGGGGSGTVTTVSCDPLSPLFTCSVLNPTTTPEIQFTLDTAQNLGFFGNVAGSTGPPSFVTLVAGANITLTPNTGVTPNTLTIASSGSGGGCEGPLPGDATSTNCGNNNLVGNTATAVQTFGYTNANVAPAANKIMLGAGNLINDDLGVIVNRPLVGVGYDNFTILGIDPTIEHVYAFGEYNFNGGTSGDDPYFNTVAAVGYSNFCASQFGDNTITDTFVFGELNDCFTISGTMIQHNLLVFGDTSMNPAHTAGTDTYNDIILGGDTVGGLGNASGNDTSNDLIGWGNGTLNGFNNADVIAFGQGSANLRGSNNMIASGENVLNAINSSDVIAAGQNVLAATGGLSVNATGISTVIALGLNVLQSPSITGLTDVICMGDGTCPHVTGGTGIIALGNGAGGLDATGNHGYWIGDGAGPNGAAFSNTVAFGFNAVNTASNQTVIGNSSTTSLVIFGSGDGCLSSSSGVVTGSGVACGSGGGGSAFSAITGSTNTTATMLVGTGASLSFTGSGVLNANQLGGIAISGTPATGSILTATSSSAASWASPAAGTVTSVATGSGLTGGTITASGTISCVNGSSSVFGCIKVDGTTITASSGVISAVGGTGTVTSSGSPTAGAIAAFTSATNITTATATQVNTLIKTLTGCNTVGNVYTPQAADCVAVGAAGVSSFTGDGLLANNSVSTGAVTLTLATAAAHTVWGNRTGSTAAPSYSILVSADIPNNAASTSGNAGTATALAATPTLCTTGQAPTGILANGNATGCAAIGGGGLAFSSLTSGTNTAAAMLVGTGASLAPTGSGTITPSQISLAGSGAGGVGGNLSVAHLNSGTGATSSTFWRGDGTWATPGGGGTVVTICSGTVALPTTAISSGTNGTITTATCTGLLTTDNIQLDFNGNPTATTGFFPSTSGTLTIYKWPTAGQINVMFQNNTGSVVTPGAISVNYHVFR